MLQKSPESQIKDHEFVSMIAHDFLSPLHTIRGYIEVLKLTAGHKLSEAENIPLEAITHISEEFYETLETLIALFKNEHQTQKPTFLKTGPFIKSLEALVHLDLLDKKIDLVCDAEIQQIKTHPGFLKQILLNLLKNAIKASPKSGKITLAFKQAADKKIAISVTDHGPGIDGHILEKYAFIQQDKDNAPLQSSRKIKRGLGLYIIENCLPFLKATLTVSTSTSGTTFTLHINPL